MISNFFKRIVRQINYGIDSVNYGIDSVNFDLVGQFIWLGLCTVNSLIVWLMPLFFKVTGDGDAATFYLANLDLALIVGLLGVGTFFFPFVVIHFAWEALTKWAEE